LMRASQGSHRDEHLALVAQLRAVLVAVTSLRCPHQDPFVSS